VLETIRLPYGDDCLAVPVKVGGKEYAFILDTGASHILFDTSLPLGRPRDGARAVTPTGETRVNDFDPPNTKLGSFNLTSDAPVYGVDLAQYRRIYGRPVCGLVGMDFLKRHVIQIDFDAGEMRFLKAADGSHGDRVELSLAQAVPTVKARLSNWEDAELVIDTGATGLSCGYLTSPQFDRLHRDQKVAVVGETRTLTLSDDRTARNGRLSSLSVGDFTVKPAYVVESGRGLLGLNFWSRFVVTFDFPNSVAYLKKGKQFDRPDLRDLSGLHLLRDDGKTYAEFVDKTCPAADCGIKDKDVFVKIGDNPCEKLAMAEIRRMFATPGASYRLTIRRGNAESEVTLTLPRS
jgi:hypothetical protein